MSQIIKPVMLDETGQTTNTKLENLKTTVSDGDTAKVAKLLQIAEAIESVHSVNGMTGDVVIDSTNIKLNKLTNNKTIAQVLAEEQSGVNSVVSTIQQAISRTPLTFSTSQISGDDYLLTFTLGTP